VQQHILRCDGNFIHSLLQISFSFKRKSVNIWNVIAKNNMSLCMGHSVVLVGRRWCSCNVRCYVVLYIVDIVKASDSWRPGRRQSLSCTQKHSWSVSTCCYWHCQLPVWYGCGVAAAETDRHWSMCEITAVLSTLHHSLIVTTCSSSLICFLISFINLSLSTFLAVNCKWLVLCDLI